MGGGHTKETAFDALRRQGAAPSTPEPAAGRSKLATELRATRLRQTVTRATFPGTELPVDICLISDEEVLEAKVEAYDYLKKKKLPEGCREYAQEWDYARQVAILCRCLLDPETGRPAFRLIEDLRPLLSRAEADRLGTQWDDHQQECAPLLGDWKDDDLLQYGDDVKKSRNWRLYDYLPASMLRRLLRLQGERPGTPTGSSSSHTTNDSSPAPASSTDP